jgi:hypothetical protein
MAEQKNNGPATPDHRGAEGIGRRGFLRLTGAARCVGGQRRGRR